MYKIVYILVAGFSAPLGIPTMRNFLSYSKDIYSSNPDRFSYFNKIYQLIDTFHKSKNYIEYDLFNIEEILSIIDMQSYVFNKKVEINFKKFISDVIKHSIPEIPMYPRRLPGNWHNFVFGTNDHFYDYGAFISSLLGPSYRISDNPDNKFLTTSSINDYKYHYSVISLNYDTILEDYVSYIENNYESDKFLTINFGNATHDENKEVYTSLDMAKIHGTVDPINIIPPTWDKTRNKRIKHIWKFAYEKIKSANEIRFLGYSIPHTDNHFKYLLISGIIDSQNLKKIDALCLDTENTEVEKNYESIINFRDFRFKNANILDYLKKNAEIVKRSESDFSKVQNFDKL